MKTRKKTKNSLKKKIKKPTQLKPFWKMDIAELCEYSEKWKKYDEDIKNNKNNSHNKPQNITQKNFKGIIKTNKKKTNKTFKFKKKYIRKTRKLITI